MDKVKVLIVEDEVLIAEDIKFCLIGLGYDVVKNVESGELALKTIEKEAVDLVLMDILLKDELDGIQTAKLMKDKFNTPIIYMTSHSDQATLEAAKETEPLGYILKPFSENELYGTIELALHKHQMNLKYQESLNQFKYIYENAPIGIYRTTPDDKILMANPKLLEMLGFNSLEELQQIKLAEEFFHPQYSRDMIKKKMEAEGGMKGWETVWFKHDGTHIHIRENAISIKNHQGKIIYYEGTVEDITDKKRLEEKLKIDEQQFRVISEISTDFRFNINIESSGEIICDSVSDYFIDILGIQKANIRNFKNILNYVHTDDVEPIRKSIEKLLRNHDIVQLVRVKGKGGKWLWIQFQVKPVWDDIEKRVVKFIGAGHDLTHEKMVEEELRESEERYRDLVEKAHLGIIISDADGKVIYCNRQAPELFGYSYEEAMHLFLKDWIHPDDVDKVKNHHKKRIHGERVPAQYEFRGIKQNGDIIHLEVKDGLYKKKNKVLGIRTYLWDVTIRKKAEAQIEENESRFRMLYEGVPVGYQSLNVQGKIVEVNQKWCHTLGYAKRDVLGQQFTSFLAQEGVKSFTDFFDKLKEKGHAENFELELLHKKKSKSPVVMSLNGSVTYGMNKEIIECHCIFTDITERCQMEGHLRESEERYKKLMSVSNDAIAMVQLGNKSAESKWIEVNEKYCKLLGYTYKELFRIPPLKTIASHKHEDISKIEKQLKKDGSAIFNTIIKTKSKENVFVEVNAHMVKYCCFPAVVAIVRDLRDSTE